MLDFREMSMNCPHYEFLGIWYDDDVRHQCKLKILKQDNRCITKNCGYWYWFNELIRQWKKST